MIATMETRTDTPKVPTSQNVLFMPSVYNEAMTLLHEAQDYFTEFGDDDQRKMDKNIRAVYACEMSRITLRLSCVMSWLLAQRSVVSGQIDAKQSAHYGLEFQNICRVDNKMLHGILPSYVCYLLDSTFELYERVLRLNSQIEQIH
jgi:regulator of CtrA degradation